MTDEHNTLEKPSHKRCSRHNAIAEHAERKTAAELADTVADLYAKDEELDTKLHKELVRVDEIEGVVSDMVARAMQTHSAVSDLRAKEVVLDAKLHKELVRVDGLEELAGALTDRVRELASEVARLRKALRETE